MRLFLAGAACTTLAGCANTGSVSLTLLQAQDGAELAFSGLDLATNAALTAGLRGHAEHILRMDYEKAHTALLAMRAGTGSAQAALDAITATKKDLP